MMALKELVIRFKYAWNDISAPFAMVQQQVEAYLNELQKIDIEAYERECKTFSVFCESMLSTNSEEEMNHLLKSSMGKMGFELPWDGDFDEFMSDSNNKLVFS